MMKRRAVLAVLIGMSIYACNITAASEVAYAAEASSVHDAVAKEKDSYGYYDPAAFSERIKKKEMNCQIQYPQWKSLIYITQ